MIWSLQCIRYKSKYRNLYMFKWKPFQALSTSKIIKAFILISKVTMDPYFPYMEFLMCWRKLSFISKSLHTINLNKSPFWVKGELWVVGLVEELKDLKGKFSCTLTTHKNRKCFEIYGI